MSHISSEQRGRHRFLLSVGERKTSFLTIIHCNIIKEQHLVNGLPSVFSKKHGTDFTDGAILNVPSGDSWKVKVRKANETIWLGGKGWLEFVDHYSISVGHILFFRYDLDTAFHVIICDMSTNEIDYQPSKIDKSGDGGILKSGRHSVENVGTRSNKQTQVGHQQPRAVETGEPSVRKGRLMKPYYSGKGFASRNLLKRESSAVQAARGFESENPSLMLVMQPSYVKDKFSLNVSAPVIKAYLGGRSQDVKLCVSDGVLDGRVWEAHCCVYNENLVKIYSWKPFAVDNRLKVNDVCVFELITPATFKVSIYRAANKTEATKGRRRCAKGSAYPIKGKVSSVTGSNLSCAAPSFIITLTPSYAQNGILHLPTNFVKAYLQKKSQIAKIVDSKGSKWFVDYKYRGVKAHLGNGWDAIISAYELRVGSVCAFELIDAEDFTLKFSILTV